MLLDPVEQEFEQTANIGNWSKDAAAETVMEQPSFLVTTS